MLRITVHNDSADVTFQLEGRLTEPWIEELANCWDRAVCSNGQTKLRVDLTGLTFVDSAGKRYLKTMHHRGAKFNTADCETKSIVDEITGKSASHDHVRSNGHNTKKKDN